MTRGPVTNQERAMIAACSLAALAFALFNPWVFERLRDVRVHGSFDPVYWLSLALSALPLCCALVAVVLTARPPAGTMIAVVAGVVAVVMNLHTFDRDGTLLGARDYLLWVLWAALVGCALLIADAMAWRLGRFTTGRAVVAGLLVGIASGVVKVGLDSIGPGGLTLHLLPASYWVGVYVLPAVMLVLTGAVGGALAGRLDVAQETAGRA